MNEEVLLRQQEHQRDLARLRGLRPIDDDFMRCIFRDNVPLAQFVLRILIDKPDLEVLTLETQKDFKRLAGARSVCLDAYATDSEGRKYDIEIQRSDRGAGARRARYHSSSMDIENLDAGQDFDELPETYTIFITEQDVIGRGKPCYRVERVYLDNGLTFEDGAHILYVNGAYRDESEIGRLMHDFSCWNPDDMTLTPMKEVSTYYKQTPEGVRMMCRAFEETRQEGFEKGMQQGMQQGIQQGMRQGMLASIRSLMETMKLSAPQAMDILKISKEEQEKYAGML